MHGKIRAFYKTWAIAVAREGLDMLNYEIYGAIETDIGLVYVTKKMDKKGDGKLKLL